MSNAIEADKTELKPAYVVPASSGGLLPAYPGKSEIMPLGENYSKPGYSTDYN